MVFVPISSFRNSCAIAVSQRRASYTPPVAFHALQSTLDKRTVRNSEYPHFWNVGTEERIWYPPNYPNLMIPQNISVSEYCSGSSHGTWPNFSILLITIHGACTARVRAGLGPSHALSGMSKRQPINVTMEVHEAC